MNWGRQILSFTIRVIVAWLTKNCVAKTACFSPKAALALIILTFSQVSLAHPFRSPCVQDFDGWTFFQYPPEGVTPISVFECVSPQDSLPLFLQSCMFANWSPRNRWSGLQQGGLSQWWQTPTPSGIGPFESAYAIRCVKIWVFFGRTRVIPYPVLCFPRVQSQHPFGPFLSTLDQKSFCLFTERLTTVFPERKEISAACIDSVCELLEHSGRDKRFECSLFVRKPTKIGNT